MESQSDDGPEEPEIRFNRRQIGECVGYLLIAALDGPDAVEKELTHCMKMLWRYRQKRFCTRWRSV